MTGYTFTEQEAHQAADVWGANCGPLSLAFALQVGLDAVRGAIPGFEDKGFTSPTMMKAALANLGRKYIAVPGDRGDMFAEQLALMRVQWTGPWTKPGANPKWAYRQTHWLVTWAEREAFELLGFRTTQPALFVFDCNGGTRSFASWQKEIVPLLTANTPRADGGWFHTHVWRIMP